MRNYKLTSSAKKDLRDISRYTIKEWGIEQDKKYMRLLDICFDEIGKGVIVERLFKDGGPGIYVKHCEHHFVFYLRERSSKAVIFAVLHEQMDLIAQLKKRLLLG